LELTRGGVWKTMDGVVNGDISGRIFWGSIGAVEVSQSDP